MSVIQLNDMGLGAGINERIDQARHIEEQKYLSKAGVLTANPNPESSSLAGESFLSTLFDDVQNLPPFVLLQ